MVRSLLILSILMVMVACTGGFDPLAAITNENPIVGSPSIVPSSPIVEPPSEPEFTNPLVATQKVEEVLQSFNEDPIYKFEQEDTELLISEGLIADQNSLKGLVK
ncbi:hypothetical protein [Bdellovibrio sp. HCB274]|uniref:hypothetical protein n=1 Tax=Bdellovibrio sp. HCB274 TaxID=3394361 RepID=UPI0039B3A215